MNELEMKKFSNRDMVEVQNSIVRANRIKEIRQYFCDGNNAEFASRLGVSKQYSSGLCTAGERILEKTLEKILEIFPEVSRSWLYFGEGDMLVNSGEIRARDVGGDLLGHGATKVSTSSDDVQKLVDIITAQQETIAKQSDQIGKLIEKLTNL